MLAYDLLLSVTAYYALRITNFKVCTAFHSELFGSYAVYGTFLY